MPIGDWSTKTYLLSMHPNAEMCKIIYDGTLVCETPIFVASYFSYLLEGETYYDEFNKMSISVLEANESGALVKISPLICGDANSDGKRNIADITYLVDYLFVQPQ